MANSYCGLIIKLIYWKNDVIRNDVIFHDVTRCSMATIFLLGFNVLVLIFYHSFVVDTKESILLLLV